MAHFAEINSDNNKVLRVIVIGQDQVDDHGGENSTELEQWVKDNHPNDPFIDYSSISDTYWKRTSYNTFENKHLNGGTAFRGNYAGIGYNYDSTNDIFHDDKPFPSWTFNLSKANWEAPVEHPTIYTYGDGAYYQIKWDEDNQRWKGLAESSGGTQTFIWDPDISSWISTAE